MTNTIQVGTAMAISVFIIAILGAIFVMIGPVLQGVGAQTAGAMGTNLSTYYNSSLLAANNAATGYGSTNQITPYLVLAFGILAALGISLAGFFKTGGKRHYSR